MLRGRGHITSTFRGLSTQPVIVPETRSQPAPKNAHNTNLGQKLSQGRLSVWIRLRPPENIMGLWVA